MGKSGYGKRILICCITDFFPPSFSMHVPPCCLYLPLIFFSLLSYSNSSSSHILVLLHCFFLIPCSGSHLIHCLCILLFLFVIFIPCVVDSVRIDGSWLKFTIKPSSTMTLVSERFPSAGKKNIIESFDRTISMMEEMNRKYDWMISVMECMMGRKSLSTDEQTQLDTYLSHRKTSGIQLTAGNLKEHPEIPFAGLEERIVVEEKKSPRIAPSDEEEKIDEVMVSMEESIENYQELESMRLGHAVEEADGFRSTPAKKLLPTREEANSGRRLEKIVAAKKKTSILGVAIGPEFHHNEFKGLGSSLGSILELNGPNVSYHIEAKPLGIGLVLEAAQQKINILSQQAQLHTNPIFFISPNDFNCPNSSLSSATTTIFFTSPNTFSGSILSSSCLKLNPISSLNTHQLQRTHSNSIFLQLSPFLRPPRKPPDYVNHSNLEDKVLLRGVICHG